ncbi:MAG: murein transglycosylase [Desulfobacteraceae bacterium]|nr:murein transglycosylase [Desulfobacteraceae bacterium]
MRIGSFRTLAICGAALIALIIFSGCGHKKPVPVTRYTSLSRLAPADYPRFHDALDRESLEHSLAQSLVYFNRVPESRTFQFGPDGFDAGHMRRSMEVFLDFLRTDPMPSALDRFIRERYHVYGSVGNRGDGVLFTGYYEPSMEGSLVPDEEYRYPLFSVPDNLLTVDLSAFSDKYDDLPRLTARVNENNRVVPYFSRKEINALENFEERAKPLAWVRNRTDRFFLEIQGSGRINLKQGGVMHVHYSTKNGHPYKAIGRYLIDRGEIPKEEVSMQTIRAWLESNPARQDEVFDYNPSFVFFQEEQGGPFGCINVQVTPMRSIATDRTIFPKGALCFIETAVPSPDSHERPELWKSFSGFVMNQDTGGAIKGPSRCDLFYGNGRYAEFGAGHMKHRGSLYFLVLRR